MMEKMKRTSKKCPHCGSSDLVKIVYGLPDVTAGEAAARGEIILGGCCVTDNDPTHHCNDCEKVFLVKRFSER